jgi:hypothetical protein
MPQGPRSAGSPQLLRRWLDQLRAAGHWFPGATVATVYRAQLLGLCVAGGATGWLVTAALFNYDGSKPVNVVHVLAALVGIQLLLLLLLGLVSIPARISRYLPGLRILQDLLALLSPGQITHWLARRLPEPLKDAARGVSARLGKDPWPLRVLRWSAMVSAQTFGVSFNLGALAAALYLVVFSDLAFSWSTTLRPDVDRGQRVTRMMAAPWSAWWPEAVPSRTLIESTLYYRLRGEAEGRGSAVNSGLDEGSPSLPRHNEEGTATGMNPAGWGGWWPFLVANLCVYGLLPRLILLGVGSWRLRATLNGAMCGISGVEEAMDRLTTEAISTQAVQPEGIPPGASHSGSCLGEGVPAGHYWVVDWGGLGVSLEQVRQHFAGHRGFEAIAFDSAGGSAGFEADGAMIERIADREGKLGGVILVKSWEPPMLEFLDFVGELRKRMGRGRRLVVVLLGLGLDGKVGAPRAVDVAQWRRRLESLMDEDLTVATWGEELV